MEDQINADCPVCGAEGADLAACKGEPAQEETKCICAVPCTEGAINKECPVCGSENADLTKCEGKETVVSDVLGRDEAVKIIIKCQNAYIEKYCR